MNATEESITAPQHLHDFLWTSASYLGLRPRTGGEAEGLRAASLPAHLRGTGSRRRPGSSPGPAVNFHSDPQRRGGAIG